MIHKGVVKANGLVDTSQTISDVSKLKVSPSDDSFRLKTFEIGNFEWWYFDISDEKAGCVLKIVVHLGTDPLRRRFYPQLAISIKTPAQKHSFTRPYSRGDFYASTDYCDVRLKDEFHALVESPDKDNLYHVMVNTQELSANVTFVSEIEGWKPLGDEVTIQMGKKKGASFWVIPVPKARVTGEFTFSGEKYQLQGALGYHDHNYWKVGTANKLFMDDALSKWYWGRSFAKDYTIIFMDTYLRTHRITSLMIAREDKIIHSSTNSIEVLAQELREDKEMKTPYPSRITIRPIEETSPFQVVLNLKEVIDRRNLLEGVHPFIKRVIKLLVSKPAYYGMLAEATVTIGDEEIKGMAIYELMSFRNKE